MNNRWLTDLMQIPTTKRWKPNEYKSTHNFPFTLRIGLLISWEWLKDEKIDTQLPTQNLLASSRRITSFHSYTYSISTQQLPYINPMLLEKALSITSNFNPNLWTFPLKNNANPKKQKVYHIVYAGKVQWWNKLKTSGSLLHTYITFGL